MYESLGSAHADVAIEHDYRPISGTAFVRNLVRAVWEESIYRTEAEINDKLYEDRFQYGFYRDVKQTYTENDRNAQSYHSLIQKRIEVQFWREELKRTTYAFSMDIDYQRSQPQLPTKLTEARESRIWARLHEKLATMESTISNHTEAFSARAALEVSFAAYRQAEESKHQTREANEQTTIANRHARSAGQLTKIATIIVPCTFVASIFSMGGSFAAGEHLFFVYWAISVPITAALLAWVLHKDIKEMWHKWRGHQNKEEKQADKMA
jgi:Mg2+ and Co2+ transporter CorA